MEIVLQCFDGCPHWETAYHRLREVLGPRAEIAIQKIADASEVERIGFRGSPTILVDGTDPFGEASVGFACRRYGLEGAPTLEEIRHALARQEEDG